MRTWLADGVEPAGRWIGLLRRSRMPSAFPARTRPNVSTRGVEALLGEAEVADPHRYSMLGGALGGPATDGTRWLGPLGSARQLWRRRRSARSRKGLWMRYGRGRVAACVATLPCTPACLPQCVLLAASLCALVLAARPPESTRPCRAGALLRAIAVPTVARATDLHDALALAACEDSVQPPLSWGISTVAHATCLPRCT